MNKETVVSILFAFLLLLSTFPVASALPPSGTDTTTLVIDTIGEPETTDPAWAYDTASSEVLQNVYEPLAAYMIDRRLGPYEAGLVDEFTPRVATWGTLEPSSRTIRPEADGFKTWSIEPKHPPQHFDKVDEAEPNDDADYVYTSKGDRTESFALSDPTPTGTILHVTIAIVARNTLESNERIVPMLVIGNNKYTGRSFNTTTSYGLYTYIWSTNPYTLSAWTWTDINDLEAGFKSEKVDSWTGELRVTQLYVHITARPAQVWMYEDIPDYVQNGVTIKYRFYFEIRTGIPFHPGGDGTNWGTLTCDDVEYSFERALVQDRDGGPTWMLYEYLLNTYGASPPYDDPLFGLKIDHAIDHNDTHVWFNIASDFSPVAIMQINAQFGILCKAWAQSLGDLNVESVQNGWANWTYIYNTWRNPPTSFMEYVEGNDATKPVGTGPYKFWYWSHGSSWAITKFDDYWDGWPSRVIEDPINPGGGDNRISGFLTKVVWYLRTMWTTRRPRFLAGDSDFTVVDPLYRDQVLGQPGIRCYYPISVLSTTGYFYTFDISETSPYVLEFYQHGQFGTNGIPPDIFSDVNVRMGFAYAFDYDSWLNNVYLGEGWQPPEAIIRGVAYNRRPSENIYAPYDEEDPALLGPPFKWYYNMALATYHLKLAWGGVDYNSNGVIDPINEPGDVEGALWTGGMKFTIPYSMGNVARQLAAEMITYKINSLNPGVFVLDPPFAVPYGSTYLPQMVNGELPLFIIGWGADYPDPHNFAYPFYHSTGTFAAWQRYSNPTMDSLIETGIETQDGLERSEIYREIQELAVTDCPSVTLVQALERHYERDWMRGWYYHPIAPDNYYHFYKAASADFGDCNNDGYEDILDKGFMAGHWSGAPGTTYNPSADVSGGTGATTGSEWGLVVGIPDGIVDTVDLAVLSANWD